MLSRNDSNAFYVIDNYGYVDLQTKGKNKDFKNAEWYWKVDRDPEIRLALLANKPDAIGYIGLTPQMEHDITTAGLDLTLQAWHNSKPYVSFWNDGWGVEFWITKYPDRILSSTWQSYKKAFIKDGKVSGKNDKGSTTSEAQSYAMLRAVWMNDKNTFDAVYSWLKTNMLQSEGLYSWRWENDKLLDNGTASDADQDIALALIFAAKYWNNKEYLADARTLLSNIWETEVATVDGKHYMTAANWANHEDALTLNPSYLSPAYYPIFAEVDKNHPWGDLVATSYEALEACTFTPLNASDSEGVLPPEWCSLNKRTLEYGQPGVFQPRATEYAYNAFRVPWRVALDYSWHNSGRAKDYLARLSTLGNDYSARNKLSTAYTHAGDVWEEYESVAAYSGNLGYFYAINPDMAKHIYETKILPKLFEDAEKSYWEDPDNYFTQNWGWFGTALYTNNLPNLWHTPSSLSSTL